MTYPITYKHGYPKLMNSLVPMASGAPFQRDPTSSDLVDSATGKPYAPGTVWPNEATKAIWMLGNITSGNTANWVGISDAASGDVIGPSSSTDNAIMRWDGATGKVAQNSTGLLSDNGLLSAVWVSLKAGTATAGQAPLKFASGTNLGTPEAGAMEYDGTNLYFSPGSSRRTLQIAPFTGGSAATRGTFTLTAGASGDIATTAIATGSTVILTVTALSGATAPQAMLVTITNGVKFTITSADNSDTSSGTWAIL